MVTPASSFSAAAHPSSGGGGGSPSSPPSAATRCSSATETSSPPACSRRPLWAPIVVVLFAIDARRRRLLYGYGRDRTGDAGPLDERERTMLDRALVLGYGAVVTVVVLAVGAIALYLSFVGPITIRDDRPDAGHHRLRPLPAPPAVRRPRLDRARPAGRRRRPLRCGR